MSEKHVDFVLYSTSEDLLKEAYLSADVVKDNIYCLNGILFECTNDLSYNNELSLLTITVDGKNDIAHQLKTLHSHFQSMYDEITNKCYTLVDELFKRNNIAKSHDIKHIDNVRYHTKEALKQEKYLTILQRFSVEVAAIEHDTDDGKLFDVRASRPYDNAHNILSIACPDLREDVVADIINMISYVSASKNRNNIPEDCILYPWKLIPRYADRLEAGGKIGVIRCYLYSKETNRPLYDQNTLRPESIDKVWDIATVERYEKYDGESKTMIDHYYDKLLRLTMFETNNIYFLAVQKKLIQPLLDVIELFIRGELTCEHLERLTKE